MGNKLLVVLIISLTLISFVSARGLVVPEGTIPINYSELIVNLSTNYSDYSEYSTTSGLADCWSTTEGIKCDVSDISYDEISGGDVNALGYTGYFNYLAGVVGQLSMDGSPWYLGGTDLEIDQDLQVNNTVIENLLEVGGDILPLTTLTSSIGSGAKRFLNLYVQNINAEEIDAFNLHLSENLTVDGNITTPCITLEDGETYCTFATTYYNATSLQAVEGTYVGTINLTQHPTGNYDGITLNITEQALSPGLDFRFNFTNGITEVNAVFARYRTSSLSGDAPLIQLWDYCDEDWEGGYGSFSESQNDFINFGGEILDGDCHVQDGTVQMRLYKLSNGNINNEYYIDMLAVTKGFATPSGNVDLSPYWKSDGSSTATGNWQVGGFNITNISGVQASVGNFTTLNLGINTIVESDVGNWNTHIADNTQAHSDYLINNGDDTTSGSLTAGGFTTIGQGSMGSLIVNEVGSASNDFRVESDNQENAIFVDSSSDFVGLGSPDLGDVSGYWIILQGKENVGGFGIKGLLFKSGDGQDSQFTNVAGGNIDIISGYGSTQALGTFPFNGQGGDGGDLLSSSGNGGDVTESNGRTPADMVGGDAGIISTVGGKGGSVVTYQSTGVMGGKGADIFFTGGQGGSVFDLSSGTGTSGDGGDVTFSSGLKGTKSGSVTDGNDGSIFFKIGGSSGTTILTGLTDASGWQMNDNIKNTYGTTNTDLQISSDGTYGIINATSGTKVYGGLNITNGFTGSCVNVTYSGGIAMSCND